MQVIHSQTHVTMHYTCSYTYVYTYVHICIFKVCHTGISDCRSYNVSNNDNPLYNDDTEDLTPPESSIDYERCVPVSDEIHEYVNIDGDHDTINSNQMSYDEPGVYYNTNASRENVLHYDTPKPLSKPTKPDHHFATSESLPTEDDDNYVPPGIIENQFALLDKTHRAEGDQYSSLAESQPPVYQELIGQRPPSSIYTIPIKTPATN